MNAITKSGTNNLHGDLFYFLRYPTLNALDPLTKYNALHNQSNPVIKGFLLTQPTHQQQEFGGSVGGPIIQRSGSSTSLPTMDSARWARRSTRTRTPFR